MSYPALAIANAFLDRAEAEGRKLSNMKLQKLLYFADGHSHAMRGESLIGDSAQAWDYGPVYPNVYREFQRFGAGPITARAMDDSDPAHWFMDDSTLELKPVPVPVDADVNSFLDAVWNAYKGKTAIELSQLSHVPDGPWAKARASGSRSSIIKDQDVAEYFSAAREAAQAKKAHAAA